MTPEATRPAWNDERTDELAERTEENLRDVRGELRELRELRDRIDRRSDIILGAMTTGFVGLIIAHFIG
jgi:hypothetical protein